MRIRIEGPCFIESEQSITIIPIYQNKHEQAKVDVPRETEAEYKERIKPNYPKHRKPRKKVRKSCLNCSRQYNGDALQKYCSKNCKREFYRKSKEVADVA